MRKVLALLLVFGIAATFGAIDAAAQGETSSGFQILKQYFIDGDWRFMSFV